MICQPIIVKDDLSKVSDFPQFTCIKVCEVDEVHNFEVPNVDNAQRLSVLLILFVGCRFGSKPNLKVRQFGTGAPGQTFS